MPPTKKYTSLETRRRIVHLAEKKLTEQEIADRLDLAPSTVHYWLARRSTADPGSLESRPKSGRPKKLNADQAKSVVETSHADPFSPATQILRDLGLSCCAETVRNRLKSVGGLQCRSALKKDILRQRHRDNRYTYALDHLSWTVPHWNRVLFSDEKLFTLGGHGPQRVWRPTLRPLQQPDAAAAAAAAAAEEEGQPRPDRFDPRYIATTRNTEWGRLTIMVWACVSGGGRRNRIHLIQPESPRRRRRTRGQQQQQQQPRNKRTLNADYYVSEILQKIVKDDILLAEEEEEEEEPGDGMIFMQDRSPIHTARKTSDWLERNNVNAMNDWPAKAPDLNPIENVWAEIERLLARRQCRDRHQLWMEVSQVFEDLTTETALEEEQEEDGQPTQYIRKLIESLPRRMEEVIRREGGWTQY